MFRFVLIRVRYQFGSLFVLEVKRRLSFRAWPSSSSVSEQGVSSGSRSEIRLAKSVKDIRTDKFPGPVMPVRVDKTQNWSTGLRAQMAEDRMSCDSLVDWLIDWVLGWLLMLRCNAFKHSINQSNNQSINQSINDVNERTIKSGNQFKLIKSINQIINQSIIQSINPSSSQSIMFFAKHKYKYIYIYICININGFLVLSTKSVCVYDIEQNNY